LRVPLARERMVELQAHLMLFYTGIRRDAHEVLAEQLLRTRQESSPGSSASWVLWSMRACGF
jgi:galactokinase/mevalonate kinase-like predicted kinase